MRGDGEAGGGVWRMPSPAARGQADARRGRLFGEIDAWYTEALPEPPFYKDGNPEKAFCWFKDTEEVQELVKGLAPLIDLLGQYGVECRTSRTADPGAVIYEDPFQVAVR